MLGHNLSVFFSQGYIHPNADTRLLNIRVLNLSGSRGNEKEYICLKKSLLCAVPPESTGSIQRASSTDGSTDEDEAFQIKCWSWNMCSLMVQLTFCSHLHCFILQIISQNFLRFSVKLKYCKKKELCFHDDWGYRGSASFRSRYRGVGYSSAETHYKSNRIF